MRWAQSNAFGKAFANAGCARLHALRAMSAAPKAVMALE
jgi:hypothetical protein